MIPTYPLYGRNIMKFGIRTPSFKKSFKARTTGRAKRAVKRAVIPGYGKKGVGWAKNPKRAAYNKIYNKTTVGINSFSSYAVNSSNHKLNTYDVINVSVNEYLSSKNKTTTLILAIFLGFLGIHRFYVGKVGTGIIWFLTAGFFVFGWIYDIIKIASGTFTDGMGFTIRK